MTWTRQGKARRELVVAHVMAGASACNVEKTSAFVDAAHVLKAAAGPAPKGYPKCWGIQRVIVEGTSPFPFAMLARDGSFPASETDAGIIAASWAQRSVVPPVRRVELRRVVSNARSKPYEKRWLTFGWKVVWYGALDERACFVASKSSEAIRSKKRPAKSQ
jgi:hypothetical protein